MDLHVGTSGYSYKGWKGTFYPERIAAGDMLRFYATQLAAVEINNTFYRLPKAEVLAGWCEQVPADFRFTLKASRRITHNKRLKDADDETAYLLRTTATLGTRLGTLLFQLPPNLRKDLSRLERFLDLLPAATPAAFEFRHPSWLDDDVLDALRGRRRALCIADMDETDDTPLIDTAGWGYLRLRRPGYTPDELRTWMKQLQAQPWSHAFVFFKHEDAGVGPKLAASFRALAPR